MFAEMAFLMEAQPMIRSLAIFACCSLMIAIPTTPALIHSQPVKAVDADWPLFRGNALQTGVAQTTLPDKLDIRWKVQLKKGIESTAAIVKDTVYIGCYDDHLHALDLKT